MNILFFLTPKSEVVYLYDDLTMRQALRIMGEHRYTSVPLISRQGNYLGSISEGDLLYALTNVCEELSFQAAEKLKIADVPRNHEVRSVSVNNDMEDLMEKAMNQNFVPVIDDQNVFIGIITRRRILEYYYQSMDGRKKEE